MLTIILVVIYLVSAYIVRRHIQKRTNEGVWVLGYEDLVFTLVPIMNTACAVITTFQNELLLEWFFGVKK